MEPRHGPRLTHCHLFLFGWAYYVLTPLVVGYAGLWFHDVDVWKLGDYYDPFGPWSGALLLYSALIPLAFLAGNRLAQILRRHRPLVVRVRLANGLLLVLYAGLLVGYTLAARALLFGGYFLGFDVGLTGPIATVEMVLLYQYLMCKSAGVRFYARCFGLMLAANSVVLLSTGGRLYTVSAIVAAFFYYWNWGAKDDAARRRSAVFMLTVPIVMAALGSWRLGELDLGPLGFYLFAEPVFTSISGVTLVQGGSWSWLDLPRDFGSAFLNIVPSVFWPGKADLMVSLLDSDLRLQSPLGAMSIIASSIGNFGYVGGLTFFVGVGYVMGRARRNATSPVTRALYCYLSCLLPFLFFRDPFQIQIKLVITGFALVWLHRVLSIVQGRRLSRPVRLLAA